MSREGGGRGGSGEGCVGRRGVQWKEKEKGRRDRRKEGWKECFFLKRWQLVRYYAQKVTFTRTYAKSIPLVKYIGYAVFIHLRACIRVGVQVEGVGLADALN